MAPPRFKKNIENVMPLDIRQLQHGRNGRVDWLNTNSELTWHWVRHGRSMGEIHLEIESAIVSLTLQTKQPDGSVRHACSEVHLSHTPCRLGGQRAWWICPDCGSRAAVLYFSKSTVACRQCQRLSYPSQSESRADRALRAAGNIRRRLGWEPGVANPIGTRPKGMHLATFIRLKAKHHAAARISLNEMARSLGIL